MREGGNELTEACSHCSDIRVDEEDRPEDNGGKECRRGLVDLDLLLQSNTYDPQDKDHGHEVIPTHRIIGL